MNKRDKIIQVLKDHWGETFLDRAADAILALDEPDPMTPTEEDIGRLCEFSNNGKDWHPGRLHSFHNRMFVDTQETVWQYCRLYHHIPLKPHSGNEAPEDWDNGYVVFKSGTLATDRGGYIIRWPRVAFYSTREMLEKAGIPGWDK